MSEKDTSSGTKPPAGASKEKSKDEMMKLGNASLDFSHHDIVRKTLVANKHQDSIMGESFAIDDEYTVGRGSLADAAEAFKKSIEDPPIEEAEEAESSTPS